MKKKINFSLAVISIMITMCFCFFNGCGKNEKYELPYNAVMYGNVYDNRLILNDDFYEANLTYGSFSTAIEDYIEDENFPSSRIKIIQTDDEYGTVFKEFPIKISFEKTMIVMYCFTTASGSSYKIKNISIDGKNLSIQCETIKDTQSPQNASVPLSKWIIVTLDKSDIETAEFYCV